MRTVRFLVLLLAVAVSFQSCGNEKPLDDAAIAADLNKRGTADLLEETSKDNYAPPADGRITDDQVKMYLRVREHEVKIAEVARKEMQQHAETAKAKGEKSAGGMMEGFKALGAAADVLTADIRAAKALGLNTAEYTWVKGQILAASTAKLTAKMNQANTALMTTARQQLQKQYDSTTDPDAKKALGAMLAQSQQKVEIQENQDPAVAYNLQLLSKYEDASNPLYAEYAKFTGDTQQSAKAVEQWEKQLDSAVARAQAQNTPLSPQPQPTQPGSTP